MGEGKLLLLFSFALRRRLKILFSRSYSVDFLLFLVIIVTKEKKKRKKNEIKDNTF